MGGPVKCLSKFLKFNLVPNTCYTSGGRSLSELRSRTSSVENVKKENERKSEKMTINTALPFKATRGDSTVTYFRLDFRLRSEETQQ